MQHHRRPPYTRALVTPRPTQPRRKSAVASRRFGARPISVTVAFAAAFTLVATFVAGCGAGEPADGRSRLDSGDTTETSIRYHSRRPTPATFPPTSASTTTSTTTSTIPAPGAPIGPGTPSSPRPSVSWPPYSPLPGVSGTAALTGLAIDDATALLPIVAVKIDNTRKARGQWGLDGADVVFEENVESITRFIALFHSRQPAEVGPVRSARTGDLYIVAAMNRPVFAWSGGNRNVTDWVEAAAAAGRLVNLSALRVRCYRREPSRPRPHNLVLDMACARAKAGAAGAARPLWGFTTTAGATTATATTTVPVTDSSTPDSAISSTSSSTTTTSPPPPTSPGTPVTQFAVAMDGVRVSWMWDPANRMWLRYQDGAVHVTAGSVPLRFTNVVVVHCQHIQSPAEPRSRVPVTVGSGRVEVYRDGTVRTGTWSRADDTAQWTFTADDGTAMLLAPGTTFVELTRA